MMSVTIVYKYTRQQTEALRADRVERLRAHAAGLFTRFPPLASMALLVSQDGPESVDDAVRYVLVYSALETPDLDAAATETEDGLDRVNLPGLVLGADGDVVDDGWDGDGDAIPAFAAFCAEDELALGQVYAYFRRDPRGSGGVRVEVLGEMSRPWLDGVAPGSQR